jgi:hypothetical protein
VFQNVGKRGHRWVNICTEVHFHVVLEVNMLVVDYIAIEEIFSEIEMSNSAFPCSLTHFTRFQVPKVGKDRAQVGENLHRTPLSLCVGS